MEVILLVLLFAINSHAQVVAPHGVDMGAGKANFVCRSDSSCSNVTIGNFSVGGSTLVVSGGKVGIGTASPAAALHVDASISRLSRNSASFAPYLDFYSENNQKWRIGGGVTSGQFDMQIQNAGSTPVFTLLQGGNVGIGTASPAVTLSVNGAISSSATVAEAASIRLMAKGDTASHRNWRLVANNIVNGSIELQQSADNVSPPSTSRLIIADGGNVGIGTTAPSTKVDIASGTITMAGTGSPAKGYALCLTAAGKLSTCSNTPAADGQCTCTP